MGSIQEMITNWFGGEITGFSSIADVVQFVFVIGAGILSLYFRNKSTVDTALAKLKVGETDAAVKEISLLKAQLNTSQEIALKDQAAMYKQQQTELLATRESNAYLADILITMTMASPVLGDAAKKQIAAYGEHIRELSGIELESTTLKILNAVKNAPAIGQIVEEKQAEIMNVAAKTQETINTAEETVQSILEKIQL